MEENLESISVLIKPASSSCNLNCNYCFYRDVSSFREEKPLKISNEKIIIMIKNIFSGLRENANVNIVFQGGEPTIAQLKFFEDFIVGVNKYKGSRRVNYFIQTNGLTINEDWCKFFLRENFLVGLSVDANREVHDKYRVDFLGRPTFDKAMKTKLMLEEQKVEYNILSVLTESLINNPDAVVKFIKKENIKYIQFIPFINSFDYRNENMKYQKKLYKFYKTIYEFWKEELINGDYISIKLIDDIVNFLLAGNITACGMDGRCRVSYVVETDGSVYPCDFYALDEFKIGNIFEQTLVEMDENKIRSFLEYKNGYREINLCSDCNFYEICSGGCKRLRGSIYIDKNSSICPFKSIINLVIEDLDSILYLILRSNTGGNIDKGRKI